MTVSSSKVPCFSVVAIPSEDKILVQTGTKIFNFQDSYLNILSLREMKPAFQAIRGISGFCIDKRIQSPLDLAVSFRNSISIYHLDSRLSLINTISTPDGTMKVC